MLTRCRIALVAGISLVLLSWGTARAQVDFQDVTVESNFQTLLAGINIHGSAWGDVTGNGYPDLFIGSFGDGPNRLLLNLGNGQFIESHQPAINNWHYDPSSPGPSTEHGNWVSGGVFADFNDNGHLDLVVPHFGPGDTTRIYENNGSGYFIERTAGSNLDFYYFPARTPFTADFTGNGRLDILLQHDVYRGLANPNQYQSRLMRNDGNFNFTDVTQAAGLPMANPNDSSQNGLLGLGGAIADFTGSNTPDIFFAGPTRGNESVTNNRLFLSNPDGTYTEYANNAIFNNPSDWNTTNNDDWIVGAAAGDLNNNGRMDLIVGFHYQSTMEDHGHPLEPQAMPVQVFLNMGADSNGQPIFVNATQDLQIPGLHTRIPHIEVRDMDNDGYMDIVLSVAMSHDDHDGAQYPVVLRNMLGETGELTFTMPTGQDPSTFTGPYGRNNRWFNDQNIDPMYWPGAPVADYDRDGWLDLMGQEAIHMDARDTKLFRNVSHNGNSFVQIWIDASEEEGVNRQGIGSRLFFFEAGHAHDMDAFLGMTEIQVTNGYSSGVEAMAHFGTGLLDMVDVVIHLPWTGTQWTIQYLPTNSVYIASGSAIIPEPASLALMLGLTSAALLHRRRHSV